MIAPPVSTLQNSLPPHRVAAYLQRNGWRRLDYPNTNLLVFACPQDAEIELVLPSRQEFADYQAKLHDGIRLLSTLFGQDPRTIVHNIAHWDRDVLTIHLESSGDEQLLPLDYASKMISKYRDFMAYAAATEVQPCKFFAKLPGAGSQYVEQCMFGHTFAGSFGITIECPLGLAPEIPLPGGQGRTPFSRAVTERIATGYLNTTAAVENDDPGIIVGNHNSGFSGNMCELLADIYEMSEGRAIAHRMIWAPELSPSQHLLADDRSIALDERAHAVLKAASHELQKVDDPDEEKIIIGRIINLRSEKPPVPALPGIELARRRIVVLWKDTSQQQFKIHIDLQLEEYRQACDAHKNGRKIKIAGKPFKQGKFWHLRDQQGFSIV